MAAFVINLDAVEMSITATVVVRIDAFTQAFIVSVVSSQAIFFAASVPMMINMFDDIPIKFRDLLVLFALSTIILIPVAGRFASARRVRRITLAPIKVDPT